MSALWWERWPERLEAELKALESAGIPYEVDEEAKAQGKIVLNLSHAIDGEPMRLIASFPDEYPFMRFEIRAPDLTLARHQSPYEKNLCLIGRASQNWRNDEDSVARFVIEQLPKAIASANGGADDLEEPQGEPVSEYYQYHSGMVMIDSAWKIDPAVTSGRLLVGTDARFPLRTVVLEVQDDNGKILAEADKQMRDLYKPTFTIKWVRTAAPIMQKDGRKFFEELQVLHPQVQYHEWFRDHGLDLNYGLIGVTFPEEVKHKTMGEGWLFLFVTRVRNRGHKHPKWTNQFNFLRAGRAGRQDMEERIPQLKHLSSKKVAVIGLGSVGAPSALEFAKNGVGELRVLDDDHVEPGTTVRWPLGLRAVGMRKADVIETHVRANYPLIKVVSSKMRIGNPKEKSREHLDEFFKDIDLIYDATAEPGVHHFLSDLAQQKGVPYVLASATRGAWGGMVARFIPGDPCWPCFQQALTEKLVPNPPEDDSPGVQPVGCAAPTFTGAHYDLQEVALSGVRLAVSTLAGESGDIKWNAATLSMREGDFLPHWSTHDIPRQVGCACGGNGR